MPLHQCRGIIPCYRPIILATEKDPVAHARESATTQVDPSVVHGPLYGSEKLLQSDKPLHSDKVVLRSDKVVLHYYKPLHSDKVVRHN